MTDRSWMSGGTRLTESIAQKWENGCASDRLRNEFLIPQLRGLIDQWAPTDILDIGTATGYIPRKIREFGCSVGRWCLVDIDTERLRIARQLLPESESVSYLEGDFFAEDCGDEYDLVLLCNTALEFELDAERIAHISRCVRQNGHLVISLPDTSTDAVAAYKAGNHEALEQYISGSLTLHKLDHFTGQKMAFVAHRTTELICSFVNQGLPMIASVRSDIGNGHYIFVFRKSRI